MAKHRCRICGKEIKAIFDTCYNCHLIEIEREQWRIYREKTPQEHEDELEDYYSRECVMCGKEGADVRADGKCYCGTCWTTWNS